MLILNIKSGEFWDEDKEEFVNVKGQEIRLEHSLVSLSKWESKWHKPFLGREEKTTEETIDYIKCMTLSQNVKEETYNSLTKEDFDKINEYISDPMTATTFKKDTRGGFNREIMTSEVIYYYMIALNIPVEFQKWHLNRLMTLIRVCSIKQSPGKTMPKREVMSKNAALNAARRKAMNTKG